jgi:hypothetical protein
MKNLITILLLFCAFSVKAQLVEITDKGVFFEVKSGSTFLNNYQKGDWLPICIEYTPTSESDSTYEVGTVAHDANYFYIKVDSSPHVWNRFAKTAW